MGNSWHRNLFARAGYESDWNSTSRFRHNAPQCLMPMFVSTTHRMASWRRLYSSSEKRGVALLALSLLLERRPRRLSHKAFLLLPAPQVSSFCVCQKSTGHQPAELN